MSLDDCSGLEFAEIFRWTPNLAQLVIVRTIYNQTFSHVPPLPRLHSVIFAGTLRSCTLTPVLALLHVDLRVLKLWTFQDLAPFFPMMHPASVEQFSGDILSKPPSIEYLTPMPSFLPAHLENRSTQLRSPRHKVLTRPFSCSTHRRPEARRSNTYHIPWPDAPPEFDTDTLSTMLCVRFTR
ncbi:hypothetical protein C8R46DRAFT_1361851, partial [Mycena filopes]